MPRLTLDLPGTPEVGDLAASQGGSVYRIAAVREVQRRTRSTPGRRFALLVERAGVTWEERRAAVARADADGVTVWEFEWYERGRR